MHASHRLAVLALSTTLAACAVTGPRPRVRDAAGAGLAPETAADPREGEVPLPAAAGWRARLVLDQGDVGIWTVGALDVFPQYGGLEVVGLDDRGRCHVLVVYSGKWTPFTAVADGSWLGGLAQGDVDPRVPGRELYVSSESGNVYAVVAHGEGVIDGRLVAHLAGREVHALIACDVDPARPGDELLAFTEPGGLWRLDPRADADRYPVTLVEELVGRVRDAVVLPPRAGAGTEIATVGRGGRLRILSFDADGTPRWRTVHERPTGLGRVALAPRRNSDAPVVLWAACDDGTIWRHERGPDDAWTSELVYVGPQGARGIAAGRFAGPDEETVAVFGYGKKVELLTRGADGWRVETIFEDRDKGHWLAVGELDGRNATDELVAAGYGGRIVMLARPPGYGLPEGVPVAR